MRNLSPPHELTVIVNRQIHCFMRGPGIHQPAVVAALPLHSVSSRGEGTGFWEQWISAAMW